MVGKGEGVEGEGVESGSVMTSSGDFVSLGEVSVGVGEMGRDRDIEEERVGSVDMGTRVSLIMKVVMSGVSVSLRRL